MLALRNPQELPLVRLETKLCLQGTGWIQCALLMKDYRICQSLVAGIRSLKGTQEFCLRHLVARQLDMHTYCFGLDRMS